MDFIEKGRDFESKLRAKWESVAQNRWLYNNIVWFSVDAVSNFLAKPLRQHFKTIVHLHCSVCYVITSVHSISKMF